MKYEYEPAVLRAWMRENRRPLRNKVDENVRKRNESWMESLVSEFRQVEYKTAIDFRTWVQTLNRRQKLLLPSLYHTRLKNEIREEMLKVMKEVAETERRSFRFLLNATYQTGDFENLWKIVKHSYDNHHYWIIKRWKKENADIEVWQKFLASLNPTNYLAMHTVHSGHRVHHVLEKFYLTEGFVAFREVAMHMYKYAKESFFITEQQLFMKHFDTATNMEQQKMVDYLLKKCTINKVQTIGRLVFEKIKTYRRKPMLWRTVGDEEKKRFARWMMNYGVEEFFIGGLDQTNERFQYWKRYLHRLEDLVIMDKNTTLIMYFSDCVIVEVLGRGAVYVYENKVFFKHFQPTLDKMLDEKETEGEIRRNKRFQLSDRTLALGFLVHGGGWKINLDKWFESNLGWIIDETILKKEREDLVRTDRNFLKFHTEEFEREWIEEKLLTEIDEKEYERLKKKDSFSKA